MLNLVFDIGGVIILQPKTDWTESDRKFALPKGTFSKIVADCFKGRAGGKDFDEKKYFKEKYSGSLSWSYYQQELSAFFNQEILNKPLVNWIRSQKTSGRKVFALTNNTELLQKILVEKFKIGDIFDIIFNSAEIGLVKPDPLLFKYLLKEINAEPEKCIFVDDVVNNVNAATSMGFHSIEYRGFKDFLEKMGALEI